MVKAESQITIYDVNDGERGPAGVGIKSYVRFYKISSSTAVPHFDETWKTVEPAYDGISTNSLYFTDKIIYTDGNTHWSPVSKLSSYEAAKQAYNKADHAQDMANAADKILISDIPPSDKSKLWCDTSVSPVLLKKWDGAEWSIINDNAETVLQIYKDITTQVQQASDNILFKVDEKTYTKGEVDTLIGNQSTALEQTKDSFNFNFNNFQKDLNGLISDTNSKFQEQNKYIRFVNGEIWIGVEGNPIMLRQRNDRISFLESNVEVAYITNRILYFTNAEVLESLKIGLFRWAAEDNGYLVLELV